jgi:periplasmic protein TonB
MSSQAARHPAGAAFRLLLVAALHAGFGVLVVAGLALEEVLKPPPEPLVVREVKEDPPIVDPARTRLTPQANPDELFPPPPDVGYEPDEPTPNNVAVAVTTTVAPTGAGSGTVLPDPEPEVTAVRSDPRYPLTQPAYPPPSRRFGEEGVVIVSVYVWPNGQVGDARIEKSSGFERLDMAALKHAPRWRLVAARRDNVPYAAWYSVRVVFRIEGR